ncbi:MAG TPA: TIGR00725 family protein [Egibacteraceae bacterium]|nr:TIGR00725 family protein [Egibacteraceae bacterium]
MAQTLLAVIGPGGPDVDPALLEAAQEVGSRVAEAGAGVVCGGLDGVMAAAAAGARRAGGMTVGILPGTDPSHANPDIDIAVPSGLGEARNTLVVRAAAAVIAIGGGYGTLSEIAFALKTGTPVVGYRTWELRRDGVVDAGILVVDTPRHAAAEALRAGGLTPREVIT